MTKVEAFNKKINLVLFIIFVANVVFLPNDTFNLKKITFLLMIILNIYGFQSFQTHDEKQIAFFSFVIPTYIILKSYIITGNFVENFLGGFTGYLLFIYFVIKKYKIDIEKVMMQMLLVLAYFMVFMALLDFSGIIPTLSNPLLMWFYHSDNAMIGKGARHAFGIIYFMKSSPMLLICMPYYIKKKKLINTMIVFAALILSGTRANVILAIVLLLACYIYNETNRAKRAILIFLEILLVMAVIMGTSVLDTILNAFVMKENSDGVRDMTLLSMFEYWDQHPFKFLFGSGYASTFYNYGRNALVSNSELSYWNLLRRVGVIVFIIMMYMFLYPLKQLKKEPLICLGYIAYLTEAYFDPILYSSTGITVLLYMYSLLYLSEDNQKQLIGNKLGT